MIAPIRTRFVALGGLALLIWVLGVFWPVLEYDFVRWDDDISITQNPLITEPWSLELTGQMLNSRQAMRFKPLHWVAGRGVYQIWGFEPRAWHAFNVGFHALVASLFYLILLTVLARSTKGALSRWSISAAWLGAAFWAVHPLRAEPVAWLTGSTYPFATSWLLGSFLCYLWAHEPRTAPARGWLAAAALLATASYASYPIGVTYGIWLIAVDRWWIKTGPWHEPNPARGDVRNWLIKHACFLLPAIAAVIVTLWGRFMEPGMFNAAPDIATIGPGLRLLAAASALGYLALSIFWPVNLTPNLAPLVWDTATLASMLALASCALGALAWTGWKRKQSPAAALIIWGFAALSLPSLGLTERPTWPVDRYTYLPQLGLVAGLVVSAVHRLNGRKLAGNYMIVPIVGLLLVAAVATRSQMVIWRDSRTLFTHMRDHPDFTANPRQQAHIYVIWARHEITTGHPDIGADLLNTAQQIYINGITSALQRDDYAQALAILNHLEHHLGITPAMRREQGYWLLQLGRPTEAVTALRAALVDMPEDARTHELIRKAERGEPQVVAPSGY